MGIAQAVYVSAPTLDDVAKDFPVSVLMPGHLPLTLHPIIVDGVEIGEVYVPGVVVGGETKSPASIHKRASYSPPRIRRPQRDHISTNRYRLVLLAVLV